MAEIRALTVRQPFAWAIVAGKKKIEYRSRLTNYRGLLLIHAALKVADGAREGLAKKGITVPKGLDMGGVVGMVELYDCQPDPAGADCGYEWYLRKPRALPFIPCSGKLGIWYPDESILKRVR